MIVKPTLVILLLLLGSGAHARTLLVQMLGETVFVGDLPTVWNDVFGSNKDMPDDNSGFNCFSVTLVDPASGMEIGTGIDCLRGSDLAGANPGGLEAVSIFDMPGGILVNRGLTSVGAFTEGVGDADGAVNTLTGSIPTDATSSLIHGTNRFREIEGRARVSGAASVNGTTGAVEVLNCLWQIELDNVSRSRQR